MIIFMNYSKTLLIISMSLICIGEACSSVSYTADIMPNSDEVRTKIFGSNTFQSYVNQASGFHQLILMTKLLDGNAHNNLTKKESEIINTYNEEMNKIVIKANDGKKTKTGFYPYKPLI